MPVYVHVGSLVGDFKVPFFKKCLIKDKRLRGLFSINMASESVPLIKLADVAGGILVSDGY